MFYSLEKKDEDRFWSKVDKQFLGCWLWRGSLVTKGYGKFKAKGKTISAHRAGYQLLKGTVPSGLTLDHLCRVRSCVNPDHLEPVTAKENVLRGTGLTALSAKKTHCIRGHELAGSNLLRSNLKRGERHCRTCANDWQREKWRAKNPNALRRRPRKLKEYI